MPRNKYFLLLFLFLMAPVSLLSARTCETTDSLVAEPLCDMDVVRAEALSAIIPAYNVWETAELSGKLHMAGLPLSPSIRIFMKKSEEILISVRASIFGEVGRIEISGDSILAVNKMKRVYCAESIAGIRYDYPGIIDDLQSLLLGRAVVFRAGELSQLNADFLDFAQLHTDSVCDSNDPELPSCTGAPSSMVWSLTYPKGRTDADEFGYEYRINHLGQTERLLVGLATGDHDFTLSLDYSYPGNGFGLNASFTQDDRRKFEAFIDFNAIRWEANAFSPIKLSSRYTRVGIRQFLKSF